MPILTDWANCNRTISLHLSLPLSCSSLYFHSIQIWLWMCAVMIIRFFSEHFSLRKYTQARMARTDRASRMSEHRLWVFMQVVVVDHLDINCFWKVWDLGIHTAHCGRRIAEPEWEIARRAKYITEIIFGATAAIDAAATAVAVDRVGYRWRRLEPKNWNNSENAFVSLFDSLSNPSHTNDIDIFDGVSTTCREWHRHEWE